MKSGFALIFVLVFVRVSLAGEAAWTVRISTAVIQGGIAKVTVEKKDLMSVQGFWKDREVVFFRSTDESYIAVLGIDLEEKPGAKEMHIKAHDNSGSTWERRLVFKVTEKSFPQEKISVSSGFDRLDEATLKRIEKEQEQMARLWATSSAVWLWEGRFLPPVSGGITSPFGLRRVVNGSPRAPHTGVDLKAAAGSEIVAPNHGKVVLRDDLFFSGNTLVLDHGGGLYTMYFHLQGFAVERGAQVRKGELIGWTGMTGRVTGPHLHWGARLSGARIDPFALLEVSGEDSLSESARP